MNPVASALYPVALLPLAIVAITELFKRLKTRDFLGALTIVVAAVVGTGAGFLGIQGIDPIMGLTAGLAAVGIHTTATQAGKTA